MRRTRVMMIRGTLAMAKTDFRVSCLNWAYCPEQRTSIHSLPGVDAVTRNGKILEK